MPSETAESASPVAFARLVVIISDSTIVTIACPNYLKDSALCKLLIRRIIRSFSLLGECIL
jgi:hypothetical protein